MALLPIYTLAIAVLIVLWRREYGPRSVSDPLYFSSLLLTASIYTSATTHTGRWQLQSACSFVCGRPSISSTRKRSVERRLRQGERHIHGSRKSASLIVSVVPQWVVQGSAA